MRGWICPKCDGPTSLIGCPCDECCEKLLKEAADLAEERYQRERAVIAAAKEVHKADCALGELLNKRRDGKPVQDFAIHSATERKGLALINLGKAVRRLEEIENR